MAFLVALASSSLASGISNDVSVTFLFAIVKVHPPWSGRQCRLWKKCVRMCQNRLITRKKYKNISDLTPTPLSSPIRKSWIRHCCTQYSNENSAPLHLCVVSLCVYTVGFILWPLQKCMVICSMVVQVVLPWSWLKSLGLGLDKKSLIYITDYNPPLWLDFSSPSTTKWAQ